MMQERALLKWVLIRKIKVGQIVCVHGHTKALEYTLWPMDGVSC